MTKHKRSEPSYIANDILPLLHNIYGYPIHDAEKVKINDVPIFRPSGGRSGQTIDIVYYCEGEPLLLVEAKTEYKSHEKALKQALNYHRNFPKEPELGFSKSGKRPKFLATTVGKEIKFYKCQYDEHYEDFIAKEINYLSYVQLLSKLHLSKSAKTKPLAASDFKVDFFDELIDVFRPRNGIISRETIEKIVKLIYSYLLYDKGFTFHFPYNTLAIQKTKWVHDLFNRYDIYKSLSPELAKEFRKCVTRAFQGEEFNQYITEQSVIEFMCSLVGKQKRTSKILDFECGSGGFLAESVSKWKLPMRNIKGIDIDELPYLISKTYLAIYFRKKGKAIDKIPVLKGNGLFNHGNKYKLVIGNPAGGNEYIHGDEVQIRKDGLQINEGDATLKEYDLSVQQALRSCMQGGKICLILPDGFFTNSRDNYLRKLVSENAKIKAIISLPRGIFRKGRNTKIKGRGTSTQNMKMSILYCEKYANPKKKHNTSCPVFLASIFGPTDIKDEISDWLKEPFDFIKEQFHFWVRKKKLKKITKKKKHAGTKVGLKNNIKHLYI